MHQNASADDVKRVTETIRSMGLKPLPMPGAERTAIGVIGNDGYVDDTPLQGIEGILEIIHVTKPYKLVSRDFHPADSTIRIAKGLSVGGRSPFLTIAGPCAIESRDQMMRTAKFLLKCGVRALRGGAYKPRTSAHSFQGMREEGVRILADVRKQTGIATVTEVMSPDQVGFVSEHVDVLQIGARNMQNFDLLRETGKYRNPVILKRGLSATVEEWLASAEYVMLAGNPNVILCERGIRTYETSTRNTADLAVMRIVRKASHLPVIFDPSHATGVRDLVMPMALASVLAGAHGIMVEVHPEPDCAVSDGKQSLDFKGFRALKSRLDKTVRFALGLKL